METVGAAGQGDPARAPACETSALRALDCVKFEVSLTEAVQKHEIKHTEAGVKMLLHHTVRVDW